MSSQVSIPAENLQLFLMNGLSQWGLIAYGVCYFCKVDPGYLRALRKVLLLCNGSLILSLFLSYGNSNYYKKEGVKSFLFPGSPNSNDKTLLGLLLHLFIR